MKKIDETECLRIYTTTTYLLALSRLGWLSVVFNNLNSEDLIKRRIYIITSYFKDTYSNMNNVQSNIGDGDEMNFGYFGF